MTDLMLIPAAALCAKLRPSVIFEEGRRIDHCSTEPNATIIAAALRAAEEAGFERGKREATRQKEAQ